MRSTGRSWSATLATYAYPELADLPVAAIGTGLVVRALQPIWATKPETASRDRGRIEAILDYAKAIGYRTGENPAAWKGNLAHALPARHRVRQVQHHPSLPYAELPAFMTELRARPGRAARCLEFVILTACRTGEAIGAIWQEIDEEGRLWAIPGSRMKGGPRSQGAALERDIGPAGRSAAGSSQGLRWQQHGDGDDAAPHGPR
jgi:integrase